MTNANIEMYPDGGGPSQLRSYEYEASVTSNVVFVCQLVGSAVQVTRSLGWSYSVYRVSGTTGAVPFVAPVNDRYGTRVDRDEGGVVVSERGVLVHEGDSLSGVVPITIGADGAATASPFVTLFTGAEIDLGAADSTPMLYLGHDQFAGAYWIPERILYDVNNPEDWYWGDGALNLVTMTWDGGTPAVTNLVPPRPQWSRLHGRRPRLGPAGGASEGRMVFVSEYDTVRTGQPEGPSGSSYGVVAGVISSPR